jgi:hypothetical protein
MRTCLALLLFLLSAFALQAQQLDIFLDATNGNIVYVSNGDTLEQPQVKRGRPIKLHLRNFNNYLYDIEVKETQRQLVFQSPIGNALDTGQMLGLGGGSAGGGAGGGVNPLDIIGMFSGAGGLFGLDMLAQQQIPLIGGLNFRGKGFADSEMEAELAKELDALQYEYQEALGKMDAIEGSLDALSNEIESLLQAKGKQEVAARQLQKLQYNSRISPDQIRKFSEEYLVMIFGQRDPSQMSVNDIWRLSQSTQDIQNKIKLAREEKNAYQLAINELEFLSVSAGQLGIDPASSAQLYPNYLTLYQSISKTLENGQKMLPRLEDNISELEAQVATFEGSDFEALMQLRYYFEELQENQFSYSYSTTAQQDLTNLEIILKPKENLPANISANERQLAALQVPTKGGMKLNASVGLTFGQFFNTPQSYFVQDSIITSQDKDSFVPQLTSFLHFYSHQPGQVSFGGSFGVGLPIFNNQSGQSISFFFGPSLFMGGAQRIVLTTGLMGGRVEELTNGLEVGDVYSSGLLNLPTDFRYKLGYFLGLSINIASAN